MRRSGNEKRATSEKLQVGRFSVCFFTQPLLVLSGLRKAKVPLMVYSCGGFSRCFRIARFYDLEGPPVGVEYSKPGEGDDRRALNPEF